MKSLISFFRKNSEINDLPFPKGKCRALKSFIHNPESEYDYLHSNIVIHATSISGLHQIIRKREICAALSCVSFSIHPHHLQQAIHQEAGLLFEWRGNIEVGIDCDTSRRDILFHNFSGGYYIESLIRKSNFSSKNLLLIGIINPLKIKSGRINSHNQPEIIINDGFSLLDEPVFINVVDRNPT